MQSIIPGQISYLPVIVLIIAIAAIILILLFMKVYQVKHSAGKKDRPENWNVTPPGDIITPLPGIPEIKQEGMAEKQQPVEKVPSRILGILQKISMHWYRNTISMRSPCLQQMV